ncbi:DUF1173 family protein [Pseudomonas sp. LS-2]|nr:DUF1173 family protein [Pseudomonas sp. LS-2]
MENTLQNRRYPVLVQGKTYSVAEQMTDAFSTLFGANADEQAYLEASCLCWGQVDDLSVPTIVIKQRNGRSGHFIFRAPDTGPKHAPSCIFHEPYPRLSGLRAYDPVAIKDGMDGNTTVRLKKRLFKAAETTPGPAKQSIKLPTLKMKGLLHLLWTEAKLNRWFDSPSCERRLGLVNAEILKVAGRIITQDHLLSEHLLVHAPIGSQQEISNTDTIRKAIQEDSKLLLLAPLKKYARSRPDRPFAKLPIIGNFGLSAVLVPEAVWAKTTSRFATELKLWEEGVNVMAFALVAPRQSEEEAISQARDIVLMAVSDAWTPLQSEAVIAQEKAYRATGTSFLTPLRFDAPAETSLPDFLLLSGEKYQAVRLGEQQ